MQLLLKSLPEFARKPNAAWLPPLFGVLLLAGLWLFVANRLESEHELVRRGAETQTTHLASAYKEQTVRIIRQLDQDAKFLKFQFEHHQGAIPLSDIIDGELISMDYFVLVSIADRQGNIVSSTQPFGKVNIADRGHFKVHVDRNSDELYISAPVLGRVSKKWSIQLSRRLNNPDGSFAGVVVLSVDPVKFTSFYDQADLGRHGVIDILGQDGIVRAWRSGMEAKPGVQANFQSLLDMARRANQGTVVLKSPVDGVQRILSYQTLPNYPLIVAVGLSEDEVLSRFHERERVYLWGASATTVLVIGFIGLITLLIYRLGKSHKEVAEAHATFLAAVEGSLDAFYLLKSVRDQEGKVYDFAFTEVNDRGARLLGMAKENLRGQKICEILPSIRNHGFFYKYAQVLETRIPIEEEFEVKSPMVRAHWLHHQIVPADDGVAITARDITERKRIYEEVRENRSFLQIIVDYIPMAIFAKSARPDTMGQFVLWNKAAEIIFGVKAEQTVGKTVHDVFTPDQAEIFAAQDRSVIANAMVEDTAEEPVVLPSGAKIFMHKIQAPLFDDHNRPQYILGIAEDVTRRKLSADQLRLASKVFESSTEGIILSDADDRVIMVNRAFSAATGYAVDDVMNREASDFEFESLPGGEYLLIWKEVIGKGSWAGETTRRRKDGSNFACWLNISCIKDAAGRIANYVRVFSDISSIKDSQRQLEQLANYDTLTQLPNRNLFQERLRNAMERAKRNRQHVAVMFIDLDNFKDVNDTLGHDVGDALLKQVAGRIKGCLRAVDAVCRLGGDEFTVIMEEAAIPEDAAQVSQRILRAFAEPFLIGGHKIATSVSIGISVYPLHGGDINALLKSADVAMYQAKELGKNGFVFFADAATASTARRRADVKSE